MGWKDHLKWGLIFNIILLILLIGLEIGYGFTFFISESIFDYSTKFIFFGIAIPNIIIAFIGGLYASLFPDIDIGTSKIFHLTFIIMILILLYYAFIGYTFGMIIGLILMACIMSLKHRGIMHKSYTAFIVAFIVLFLFNSFIIALFFGVGFLVHLVCDRDLGD